MSENTVKWHKYPEEKPKKNGEYIVSIEAGEDNYSSTSCWFNHIDGFDDILYEGVERITAWAEMPEPYEEES